MTQTETSQLNPQNHEPMPDGLASRLQSLLDRLVHTSTWEASPERTRKLETLQRDYSMLVQGDPLRMEAMAQACAQGEHILGLVQTMKQEFSRLKDTPAFDAYLAELLASQRGQAKSILKKQAEKMIDFHKTKLNNFQNAAILKRLQPPACEPHHPNSLRHLPVSDQWDIAIDETGDQFEHRGDPHQFLNGRMVALAQSRHGQRLRPLKADFHAAHESNETLLAAVQTMLGAPVGILGLQIIDPLMESHPEWMIGIKRLIDLALRQLPLPSQKPSRVNVMIENRGEFTSQVSLKALEALLRSELKSLSPERYGQLTLTLEFVPKGSHPLLAYADLIAYLWKARDKTLLQRSRLLGHCLLQKDQPSLMRCFAALEGGAVLSPADWYALVGALSSEPAHSLLFDALHRLGQQVQKKPQLWQRYLDHLHALLSQKTYQLEELGAAIGWLQDWQPAHQKIPPRLQLQWLSAQLARNNHLGITDLTLPAKILELGKHLTDEAAPEVCAAHLRLAVTAMNCFEFGEAREVVQHWLEQPVAVMGLLNQAKLLSSMGQLEAFAGRPAEAVRWFDQALAAFARLSDPAQAQRESRQTGAYRLIALTDDVAVSDAALETALVQALPPLQQPTPDWSKLGAYEWHLLLRALGQRPGLLPALSRDALAAYDHPGAASNHPWELVAFWQSVLSTAQQEALGWQRKQEALACCLDDSQGVTVRWIGSVLGQLVQRLGLEDVQALSAGQLAQLREQLPRAPWDAWAQLGQPSPDQDLMGLIATCLPFNYR